MGIGGRHPVPEPAEGIAPNGRRRESVWDYPRPPRMEPEERRVRIELGGSRIADTDRGVRVLETAGAPVVYLPPDEIAAGSLQPVRGSSFCEWKGTASYYDVVAGGARAQRAAWAYPDPTGPFAAITGYVSFYPALVECRLGEEVVRPQPGGFYGGWVTAEITGPIKGEPGSRLW
jgi:uncharacterized protein (DUF427 family)